MIKVWRAAGKRYARLFSGGLFLRRLYENIVPQVIVLIFFQTFFVFFGDAMRFLFALAGADEILFAGEAVVSKDSPLVIHGFGQLFADQNG